MDIEGIIVLTEEVVSVPPVWGLVLGVSLAIVGLVIGLVASFKWEECPMFIICTLLGLLLMFASCTISQEIDPQPEYTKYEVFVEDNISSEELFKFYQNYEILEQRGPIITVKEKDNGAQSNN